MLLSSRLSIRYWQAVKFLQVPRLQVLVNLTPQYSISLKKFKCNIY